MALPNIIPGVGHGRGVLGVDGNTVTYRLLEQEDPPLPSHRSRDFHIFAFQIESEQRRQPVAGYGPSESVGPLADMAGMGVQLASLCPYRPTMAETAHAIATLPSTRQRRIR